MFYWVKWTPEPMLTYALPMKLRHRMFALRLLVVFGLVVGLWVGTHEYTHVGVAKAFGFRTDGPRWSDIKKLAPSVTYPDVTKGSWQLTAVHYSGGVAAGLALAGVYVIFLARRGDSSHGILWWVVGLIIAALAAGQLGQGLIEGRFHDAYVRGTQTAFWSQVLFLCMGLAWHVMRTRVWLSGPMSRK